MRAQVLTEQNDDPAVAVQAEDRPEPSPSDDEIGIAVSATAVCRTDLQLVTGDLPAHRLPIIPGHQVVGRVTTASAANSELAVGDRVGLVWLAGACGICRFCRSGRENLCVDATFTGYDVDGGYAEAATARAAFAHRIPDSLADVDDTAVAPLLCGGVIGYRALRVAGVGEDSSGGTLGLFGFGASASLAIQVANHWGVRCFVVTRSPREVERARELGAEWAGTYEENVPVPLDAAITFAPVGTIVGDALRTLGRGGVLAINAIHLDDIPPIDYDDLWWERSIRSVANVTRQDAREFLDLVGPAGVRTASEVLPLADAAQALARVRSGDVTGSFVLVP